METSRRRSDRRWRRALAACAFLTLPSVCSADKAAYSLDLMGIKSATAYTVVVNVGSATPAPSFRLIADTGSSNDAVLGSGCCGEDATATYSCAASSTCAVTTKGITLAFAGATISGDFVKDTWSSSEIGSISKEFLVIQKQDTFFRTEYDGITGLAYKALGKPKDSPKPTFYDVLAKSKSGLPDAFGMLLCGIMQPLLTQSNYSMHAGQLVVGGTEGVKGETYYTGPILYTPIIQEAWYVVMITDIGFDGKSLGLPCASYNQPQAIIDSGTSNMAFPTEVYNPLMALIKAATKQAVPSFDDAFFDFTKSCCNKDYCDPSDASVKLLTLPSIYITLALQEDGSSDTKSHYTVEIPPEYYFRPEMNGANADISCRAIGIAESSSVVLGDVFMDGLFSYHDRTNAKLGLAVADNCPNGVKSKKKVTKTTTKTTDWCDCFSSNLKSKSSWARYVPWGKGCFFMPWWMWVVLVSVVIVLACGGVLVYWWWTGRRDKKRLLEAQASAVAPTDYNTLQSTAAADKNRPATQQRQPPSQQQMPDSNYSIMSSPRESPGSSVARLMSGDDRRPPPHGHETHFVDHGKNQPPRKDSDRSTRSTARDTDGFLL